ncbi:CSC1-like protein RXW8 [Hibiscus syriacus]|uniref:CSC1-like protein RXW8 n=1 Tax=Hibiscus syriacus TaxID=106335 RepID=UPI001922B698|nr:CSC1-like protein RXW8 [Hibiscus syriacus]
MEVGDLLTSAGINIGICAVLLTLYSILRKQPANACVYFTRKLVSEPISGIGDPSCLTRFVPSAGWITKAWQATDEEILAVGGVDAVAFMRIVVFSIRVFIIAAIIGVLLVLPVNYNGQGKHHKEIHLESLEAFAITHVKEGSKCFWIHLLALYLLSCSACVLLYFEYKSITQLRLAHITGSPPNPSHFTVLVRGVPASPDNSYSATVEQFFSTYYAESYLSHQIVYGTSTIDKLVKDAEKIYRMLKTINPRYLDSSLPSCLPGGTTHSFMVLNHRALSTTSMDRLQPSQNKKEYPAAFVFFKTRYAALVAAQVLQSSNPMLWVTELAPEPHDVYWSNLSIPYKQVWFRKITTLIASVVFMFVFLAPVTIVQGLTQRKQLDIVASRYPCLEGILKQEFIHRVVAGYLPSVTLMLFLYTVPPIMLLFSAMEGNVSRSQRKRSACIKVLYFMIWNVFFVNVISGSILRQLGAVSSVTDIPTTLARAVPTQATFFSTYILSSGWASLSYEIMQLFPLLCNFFRKFILRKNDDPSYYALTFPHHTEIPRLLLFVLIGFTYSIMQPTILPFLLVFFFLAFLVYRNQILNVYVPKYESGGEFWPVVHNAIIFTLLLMQVIALGIFGLKKSPVASGFVIPLIVLTLLFNEYCRQRFSPVFKRRPAQILIEMDQQDKQLGRKEDIHNQIRSAYFQNPILSFQLSINPEWSMSRFTSRHHGDEESNPGMVSSNPSRNSTR